MSLGEYRGLVRLQCGFGPQDTKSNDKLAGIRVPLHVVHGPHDRPIPVQNNQMLELVYEGNKFIVQVDGASHFDVMQKSPDQRDRLR